jgi:hypothetical protein
MPHLWKSAKNADSHKVLGQLAFHISDKRLSFFFQIKKPNGVTIGRILVQREVRAPFVITGQEKFKRASQRPLIPHDDVIETLSPQGPDQLRACRDDE